MFIYKITNKVNGKTYIGKTSKSIEERFRRHFYHHKTGNTHLYRAMRKYGFDSFSVAMIEETSQLNEREIFWIKELQPEYNMTKGGDGGDSSKSLTFIKSIEVYHKNKSKESYATYGMLGKKQSQKFFESIKKSNSCPVMCEGVQYSSVGEAEKAYPGINLRKRLDNPKYPHFYRLRKRTRRG